MAQHVQGHAADEGEVLSGVVVPGTAGILAKLHIQDPVLLIFDGPVAPHDGGEARGIGKGAEEIAALGGGFIPDDPSGLHPPHSVQSGPVRFRVEPVNGMTQRRPANLNPAMVFLCRH